MKRILWKSLWAMLLFGAVLTAQASQKPMSLLFVVHASSGVVEKISGQYQLTLSQPSLSYFSDRPVRKAGKLSVEKLLSVWDKGKDSLMKDNPNAALIGGIEYLQGNKEVTHFVVLSSPVYDKQSKHLTFAIRPLHKGALIKTGPYSNMILFVDDFSVMSSGGCGGHCF